MPCSYSFPIWYFNWMRTVISWPTFIPHLLLLQFFLGAPGATLPPWNKTYSLTSSGIDSLFWSQNHLPPGGKSVLAALPLGATIWVSGKPLWGGGWWCWAFCLPVSNPPSSDWGFGNGAPPLETQPRQNQSNDDSDDFFSARLQGTQALHVSIFRLYTLTKGWILQTEMREVQATPSKKPVLNNAVQYQRTTSHSCNLNVSSSCIQVSTERQRMKTEHSQAFIYWAPILCPEAGVKDKKAKLPTFRELTFSQRQQTEDNYGPVCEETQARETVGTQGQSIWPWQGMERVVVKENFLEEVMPQLSLEEWE